ncbi:MAG: GNAT family N-acetyltransferase [Spartobacteria bacterium]|nr:GNAT family N-acetyltransferase [Spartobacteria bacterium]
MPIKFNPVNDEQTIEKVREMVNVVWPRTFRALLSPEQITYMMNAMYSTEQIQKELLAGTCYDIIAWHRQPAGYVAYGPAENTIMPLNKVYVLPDFQNQGLGSAAIRHVVDYARKAHTTHLQLRVNRNNEKAIRVYLKNGFVVTRADIKDIGGGYVMDDYILEKPI